MLSTSNNQAERTIIDEALERFESEGYKDGSLISVDWLEWALGISQPRNLEEAKANQFRFLSRFETLRDALLINHRIALQNVRGQGYRVVPPDEQAEYAVSVALGYVRKGLHKGGRLLDNARLDQMSTQARTRHTDVSIKMAALKGMVSKGRRDVFSAFRQPKELKKAS